MATAKLKISHISDDERTAIVNGVQEYCSTFEHWTEGYTRRQNIKHCFSELRRWIRNGWSLDGALANLDDERFDYDQARQIREYGV